MTKYTPEQQRILDLAVEQGAAVVSRIYPGYYLPGNSEDCDMAAELLAFAEAAALQDSRVQTLADYADRFLKLAQSGDIGEALSPAETTELRATLAQVAPVPATPATIDELADMLRRVAPILDNTREVEIEALLARVPK